MIIGLLRRVSIRRVLITAMLALAGYAVYSDWLWNWDQLIYDWQLRQSERPAPEDILIVAIDEQSLRSLGNWPWRRNLHAELLSRLSAAGAKAVVLDILFVEADSEHPERDQALAAAIGENARVVLPVAIEEVRQNGQLIESLPVPLIAAQAAALGHVDVDIDADGMLRSVHLRSGLGEPYWPRIGVAALRLLEPERWSDLPGLRAADNTPKSAWQRARDNRIWINFAGPPGHFRRVSYRDALDPAFDASVFRDKIVIVGATAVGMDDKPTPVSEHRAMPGVEIIANVIDTVRSGLAIKPLAMPWRIAATLGLILLPLLLFRRLAPRWALLTAVICLTLALVSSLLLLRTWQLWWPPANALLFIVLSYLLWSWLRLENTVAFLNRELLRLHAEPSVLPGRSAQQLAPALDYLCYILPLQGGVIFDRYGTMLESWRSPPARPAGGVVIGRWVYTRTALWTELPQGEHSGSLGLDWRGEGPPSEAGIQLLDELFESLSRKPKVRAITPIGLIQTRINQVGDAIDRLRSMRRFITDSLAQMADAVIVADGLGRVIFVNDKVSEYFIDTGENSAAGSRLTDLLQRLDFEERMDWQEVLRKVAIGAERLQFAARSKSDHDVLVQLSPFSESVHIKAGIIVTLADISKLKASERRRSEMFAFLSHDLRSPITSMIALTELAELRPEILADGKLVRQMKERAEATLALADGFLQLIRAQELDDVALEPVDLTLVAYGALEQCQPQAAQKNTVVQDKTEIDEAWMLGNIDLLLRALVNLLTNAIKYSPEGALVSLAVEQRGGELVCRIEDNGYGIAKENIPQLFQRFQRIRREEHRQESGSGLGLAFVQTVIERHQGRIEVSSEVGKGTCMALYFPAREAVPVSAYLDKAG